MTITTVSIPETQGDLRMTMSTINALIKSSQYFPCGLEFEKGSCLVIVAGYLTIYLGNREDLTGERLGFRMSITMPKHCFRTLILWDMATMYLVHDDFIDGGYCDDYLRDQQRVLHSVDLTDDVSQLSFPGMIDPKLSFLQ
jgi:hypothetical protein